MSEAYPGLEEAVSREVTRQVGALREELEALRERTVDDRAAIVVFSGDLDTVLAALVIATGAAAAAWRRRSSSRSGGSPR
jgi:hypothetical protein